MEVTELSCIAVMPGLTGAGTTAASSLLLSLAAVATAAAAPAVDGAGLLCGGQAVEGDRMGATWTHVRLGPEDWPVLQVDGSPFFLLSFPLGCSTWSPSASSGVGEGSDRGSKGRLSAWCVFLSASSLVVTRGRLTATGEGEGDSVSVQLSLRFWKSSQSVEHEFLMSDLSGTHSEEGRTPIFSCLHSP